MGYSHENSEIIFVISDLGSGGAQKVLITVANYLADLGQPIGLLTLSGDEKDFFFVSPKVKRYLLNQQKKSRNKLLGGIANLRRVYHLRKIIRKNRPKVVVGFIFATNILLILSTLGLKLKTVISERNDPCRQSGGKIWDLLRIGLYRFADIVTANTRGALSTMSGYVPEHKLRLLPNPVIFSESNDRIQFDRPTILSIGRLNHQKGFDILLDACKEFRKENKEWQLVIIGDGPLRNALKAQANAIGLSKDVDFIGNIKNPYPYYRGADIFVLPSRHEGMPNVILEALSCGVPIITTSASPGPLEYIRHMETGLVVPPKIPVHWPK